MVNTGPTLTLAAWLFPTDPTTQTKIGAVVTTINTTGTFAGGATTWPMKDSSGAWHALGKRPMTGPLHM
jgi:hypothetical protein